MTQTTHYFFTPSEVEVLIYHLQNTYTDLLKKDPDLVTWPQFVENITVAINDNRGGESDIIFIAEDSVNKLSTHY